MPKLTALQQTALECTLEAAGSYTAAVRVCKAHGVKEGYLRDLFYRRGRFQYWRDERDRLLALATDRAVEAAQLSIEYVIDGLIGLTKGVNVQHSVRLGAYRALGDYLGMWKAQEVVLTVKDLEKIKEMNLEDEVLAEVREVCKELGIQW